MAEERPTFVDAGVAIEVDAPTACAGVAGPQAAPWGAQPLRLGLLDVVLRQERRASPTEQGRP